MTLPTSVWIRQHGNDGVDNRYIQTTLLNMRCKRIIVADIIFNELRRGLKRGRKNNPFQMPTCYTCRDSVR